MGSFSNILGALGPTLIDQGIPGMIIRSASMFSDLGEKRGNLERQQLEARQQLQARQQLEEKNLYEKNELERQRLETEAATNEARRRNALRRAVARQKTLFSAQGIAPSDGGSNEAVLLGLYNDSDLEQGADDRLTTLRKSALDQNLDQTRQKNLLEATQLSQQQYLYRILNGY
ncbi:MAG TPA: hypothetical protein VIN59_00305 [Alphaproteobacteria bacterium]